MNKNNNTTYGGVGFAGVLTIVFIALKLAHIIEWSWVWVLAPLWIELILVFIIVIIMYWLLK